MSWQMGCSRWVGGEQRGRIKPERRGVLLRSGPAHASPPFPPPGLPAARTRSAAVLLQVRVLALQRVLDVLRRLQAGGRLHRSLLVTVNQFVAAAREQRWGCWPPAAAWLRMKLRRMPPRCLPPCIHTVHAPALSLNPSRVPFPPSARCSSAGLNAPAPAPVAGPESGASLRLLATLPLPDILRLLGLLYAFCAEAFAAGPADLSRWHLVGGHAWASGRACRLQLSAAPALFFALPGASQCTLHRLARPLPCPLAGGHHAG
jgi:hypothetical protein